MIWVRRFKIQIFLIIYFNCIDVEATISAVHVICGVEDAIAPLYTSVMASSNDSMTVASCCTNCLSTKYGYCGVSEAAICQCSNTVLTTPSICGSTCLADSLACGDIAASQAIDVYDTGGSGNPAFTLTVTDAAPKMDVTTTYVTGIETFFIGFDDGASFVNHVAVPTGTSPYFLYAQYNKPLIPKVYVITAVGIFPGTGISHLEYSTIAVSATPAIDLVACPVVEYPNLPYYCNVSVTYQNDVHYYTSSFSDFPASSTNITTIGSDFTMVGTLTPRGNTEDADTTGPPLTSKILINQAITSQSLLIGIDFLPYQADIFTLWIRTFSCPTGLVFCVYQQNCQTTCPFNTLTNSYSCPGDSFCPLDNACCTASPSPGSSPSFLDVPIAVIPTTPGLQVEQQYVLPIPMTLPAGSMLYVFGSLARRSQRVAGGDIVNGLPTNYSHYASMTIKEFHSISIQHTCLTALLDVTLNVIDPVVTTNLYTGLPATTKCERNITSLQLDVNQTQPQAFNASLNLENPFYVWVGYSFDIMAIFPVAGPINFNLTFTPNNGAETTVPYLNDYPLSSQPYVLPITRTIVAPEVYYVQVDAYNTHNLQPDPLTGIIPGGIVQNITIIAQFPVSPAWSVTPNPVTSKLNSFLVPRDSPSFIFVDLNGWTFPTNATITINWGDGSAIEILDFIDSALNQKPIFYHTYAIGAVYTIMCNLTNAVSASINITTTVTIYEQIFNFSITEGYYPRLTSIKALPGFGKLKNMYPMDKNLTLFPAMSHGTVESYEVRFTNNGSLIDSYKVQNKFTPTLIPLSHYFGFECLLNMTVYAINIYEVVTVDIYAEMSGLIRGLQVVDYAIVTKPGVVKTFDITFESIGAGTCLLLDFGDMSNSLAMGEELTCKANFSFANYDASTHLDMSMNVTHLYTTKGVYNITALASNPINRASAMLMFLVTNLNCSPPVISITGQVIDYLSAPTVYRGKDNFILAIATIKCAITQKTKKRWQIFAVDDLTGGQLQPVFVMNVISSWNKPELVIPAGFLNYGYFMCLYTVTMWDPTVLDVNLPFQKQERHYIYVAPTPLSTKMTSSGATLVVRGLKQSVDMEPAIYSIDPDYPTINNFSITWKCRTVGETWPSSTTPLPTTIGTTGTGCFGNGPGYVSYPSSSWKIFGKDFRGLGTFEIQAQVAKTTRVSPVIQQIQVVAFAVPIMDVNCAVDLLCIPAEDGVGVYVNPNSRMGLVSQCVDQCITPMSSSWVVTLPDGTIIPLTSADAPLGTTGSDFALSTSFYDSHPEIKDMRISLMTVNSDPSGAKTGTTTFFMRVNQRPINGNCTMDKYVGKVLLDTFLLTCSGWIDPENKGIEMYIVRMSSGSDSLSTIMEQRATDLPDQLMPLVLPIGNFDLQVTIQDVWGATTIFTLPQTVIVNSITEQEFNDAASSMLIASLLGGGNTNLMAMVISARNSIINTAPWLDVDAPNITEAERTSRMLQINDMNTQAVDALNEGMSFQTQGSTEVAAGVLADIMLKASQTPNSALTIDLFTRGDIYDILGKMVDQIGNMKIGTPEDLRKLVESVSTIAAGLVIGQDEISTPGCQRIPPKDYLQNANLVDYDTEVKSIEMTIPEDPTVAKKCNMMDLTKSGTALQMPRLKSIMDKLSSYVLQKQLAGEILDVPTKNNMTVQSGILPANPGLAGMHYCGLSWIEFPVGLCPQGNCSLPVGLSLREWPTITYISVASSDLIAGGSRTFDVDIYDKNVNLLPVNDSPDTIRISIYRTVNKRGNTTGIDPEFVQATYETQYQLIPIMYTKFVNNKTGSALTIEVTPLMPQYDRLFLLMMNSKMPTLKNHDYFTLVKDISINLNGTLALFLGNTVVNATGSLYVGIGEFADNVTLSDARNLSTSQGDITWLKKPMTVDYKIRIFTSGCYFFNNVSNSWVDAGMRTVASKETAVRCDTNHLTSFGGGLFPMPNTIDFSYVFANMGFSDNITIYLTLIIATSLFIIMLVWARWQDNKDIKKLGAAPLPDNLAHEKYLYEILVFTGNKKEAQTDSTVQFVLSGDYGDTEVRTFGDDQRKIFRKGDINVFVMAVPKPLGPLSYIRLWHDNSGKGPNASWYLSYIVFRDIQTGQKYEFICNDWFAVEKNDGQLERMIGVAGREQKGDFSHLFPNTSNKSLSDGHLWFSIFMRPPRSRFTRCQRVGTCFALLFLSMLVNAMWYNAVPSKPASGGISIGPFNLSPAQISVGVISNLIVFPPSFLIAFLFRRSRPKSLRKSRIEDALERASKHTMKTKHGEDWETDEDEDADEEGKEKQKERKNDDASPVPKKEKKKKKKKKFSLKKMTLPWWCKYLSWLLVGACVVVSVFFLLSYGIMFGNDKATKWLTALFISFFTSILFVQPIKVFLVAMLMSVLFKDVDLDEDDADADEENPNLNKDQLWLYEGERSQKLGYSKIHEDMLAELRRRRLQEIEMWAIVYELFGYVAFVWILLVVSYGQRDPNGYLLKNSLMQSFINFGAVDGTDFSSIGTTDDFWNYLPLGFMRPLRADKWYNGVPPYQLRGFLNDYSNRIMGYATIRQIRIKKNTCSIPPLMKDIADGCASFTQIVNEESRNYCLGWNVPDDLTRNTSDCQVPEFKYETAQQLQSLPIWGQRDWYGGGGYVIRLSGTTQEVLDRFTFLQEGHWIDEMTRAVIIEFSTYNSQVNLFGICTILAEMLPGGGLNPSYRFDAINLFPTSNSYGGFVIVCQVVFCLFTIYFSLREFRLLCKQKQRYFDSYWSYVELSMIGVSCMAIILYFLRDYETNKAVQIFKTTFGNGYVRMTYAAAINEYYDYSIAFLVFVGTLKFIKILRFNKRMGFLSATLGKCWEDLLGFMMAFCICFFAFVLMFYFLIGTLIIDFATVTGALATCFSMMMGKFQFSEMKDANPMAPIMFFIFVLCTSWVLVNLLITLIMKSFEEVKKDLLNQSNEYEIVDFVFTQFKKFLGKQGAIENAAIQRPQILPDKENKKMKENVDVNDLPSKVDRFLDYVNDVYFDGALDLKSKDAMKDSFYQPRQILGAEVGVGVDRIGFGRNHDVGIQLQSQFPEEN